MGLANEVLRDIQVASPCSANWNEMTGDDRTRFCRSCNKYVYNLSEMTRRQAEELIHTTEGRLCVRFYQRRDGRVLTQDCPVGQQILARRRWLCGGALASFGLLILAAIALSASGDSSSNRRLTELPVVGAFFRWLGFEKPCVVGEMPALPPPPVLAPEQQELPVGEPIAPAP
jgi:hypothetical protein